MCKVSLIRSVSYQLLQRWNEEINEHNAPEMVSDTKEAPSIRSFSKYFLIIGSNTSLLFTPFAMWICCSSSEVECTWPAFDCVGSFMRLAWANGMFADVIQKLDMCLPSWTCPLVILLPVGRRKNMLWAGARPRRMKDTWSWPNLQHEAQTSWFSDARVRINGCWLWGWFVL